MVGHRVPVQHPVNPAVDHHHVGILVEAEKWRERRDSILDGAIEEDLGRGGELRTDQEVDVTETHRERQAAQSRGQRHPRLARPVREFVGLKRVVELRLLRIGQHVIRGVPAEVDARLGDRRVTGGRDVLERQDRIALGGGLVGAGGDHPVAVGVLQLQVDPVLDFRRQVFGLELAGSEQQL